MSKAYARNRQLSEAYAQLRHPVWAWLHVYGVSKGAWPVAGARKTKKAAKAAAALAPPSIAATGDPAADSAEASADKAGDHDPAETEADAPPRPARLSFAEIEAQAHCAFLDTNLRGWLDELHLSAPDPPGSGTLSGMLVDLETVRLGALRAGNWREARAAVMDRAKLVKLLAAGEEREAPPDGRPIDVVIEEALEALGSYKARRDAITAAVRADREADRVRERGGSGALLPLSPAEPLP